ncbi:MAG TPA: Cof-type HAD-IIB family hydrolase [Ohtaekwangia sp.]|nr:Cof-type HAD-IIB family hydrolase [Ohtaekwangia sp.]
MKFKAICTDIDGTLLDSNRQLSKGTLETFKRLPDSVPVILASSRMPAAMRHLQAELNVLGHPLICFNGGYVIRYGDESHQPEVLESIEIPLSVCTGIIALTKNTEIHVSLYRDDDWHAPSFDYWTERESRITKVDAVIMDIPATIANWERNRYGAHKIMCMGPEREIEGMEQQLHDGFESDINIYRSRPTYLELAPKSISKATGLELVLRRYYDISMAEVIAFGDNYNDIALLAKAGWGVAVSNAKDEVKAVANEITRDSKADGVAASLRKYFSID